MSEDAAVVQLAFEPMRLEDVPLVGTMERRNYDFPWSDGIFRDCLRAGYDCIRMTIGDELAGYGVLQIGADEGHVLNLCIDAPYQRQGYARLFLEHLIARSARAKANVVFLEVRPSNPRALALYEGSGFNEIGLRKNYYDGPKGREDAIVMARSIGGFGGDAGLPRPSISG